MPSLNMNIGAKSKDAESALNRVKGSMTKLGRESKTTNKKMGGLFKTMQKNNRRFTNLSQDANRASTSMKRFGNSMSGIKIAATGYALMRVGNAIGMVVNSAMDMIETNNLFNVSMGASVDIADEYVTKMHEIAGLDTTNLKSSVGTFSLLARSMGLTTDQSALLSTNMASLALDLSSLTNVPIEQVMRDLKSGLLGQSETVYKYGLDVTEAALKSEALAQGIEKSVRNMSQGEKLGLRYNVMLRQSTLAQGDFAKTLETPANQARILQERIVSLGRAIGSIFIPVLGQVLPYLNAFVRVLTEMAQSLAALVGFDADEGGAAGLSNTLQDLSDDADELGSSVKGVLAGFDELNVIGDSAGGSSGLAGSILGDLDLNTYDSLIDQVKTKSSEIADDIRGIFSDIGQWLGDAFGGLGDIDLTALSNSLDALFGEFSGANLDGVKGFIKDVLVPFAEWTAEEALPASIGLVTEAVGLLKDAFILVEPEVTTLWNSVLKPFAAWMGDNFVEEIDKATGYLATFRGAFENDKPKIEQNVNGIIAVLGQFNTNLTNELSSMASAVNGAMDLLFVWLETNLTNYWDDVMLHLTSGWKNATLAMREFFEDMINGVINKINSFIGILNNFIELANKVPGVNIDTFDTFEPANFSANTTQTTFFDPYEASTQSASVNAFDSFSANYEALARAATSSSSGSGGDIVIQVDSETIARVSTAGTNAIDRQNGRTAFGDYHMVP